MSCQAPSKRGSEGKVCEQLQQRPRSDREVRERHGLVRIVTAVLVANKNHGAGDADLREDGRIVTGAAGHFEGAIEQAHQPRPQAWIHHRRGRIAGRAEIDVDAVGGTDPRGRSACLGRDGIHGRFRQAPQVEHKARFTGDLARSMHGRIGIQLARGEDQIRSGLLVLHPDSLHMMKKRHRRGDGVPAVGAGDGARMAILSSAARIAEALAAADAAHHGGGHSSRDQRRTLLDVQGPTLVARGMPAAVVSGIRGCKRFRNARCTGEYGHSGAVSRPYRRDAVAATVAFLHHMETVWVQHEETGADLVLTAGELYTDPTMHGPSKIAGETRFVLDLRSLSEATMDSVAAEARGAAARISSAYRVHIDLGATSDSPPAVMDPRLRSRLMSLLDRPFEMASGAGHDAAIFAN